MDEDQGPGFVDEALISVRIRHPSGLAGFGDGRHGPPNCPMVRDPVGTESAIKTIDDRAEAYQAAARGCVPSNGSSACSYHRVSQGRPCPIQAFSSLSWMMMLNTVTVAPPCLQTEAG